MSRSAVGVAACARCPNDTRNPTVRILASGLCELCEAYVDGYRRADLDRERDEIIALIGTGQGRYDALFGLSGGKDSTASLVRAVELGFRPLAFTFDTGYYPPHIVPRARQAARLVGVNQEVIDLHSYIRPSDLESYRLTADLYDEPEDEPDGALAERFRRLYAWGRERYSVRHTEPMAYVRTCQLCRRL